MKKSILAAFFLVSALALADYVFICHVTANTYDEALSLCQQAGGDYVAWPADVNPPITASCYKSN